MSSARVTVRTYVEVAVEEITKIHDSGADEVVIVWRRGDEDGAGYLPRFVLAPILFADWPAATPATEA